MWNEKNVLVKWKPLYGFISSSARCRLHPTISFHRIRPVSVDPVGKFSAFKWFSKITKCPASPFVFVRHIYYFFCSFIRCDCMRPETVRCIRENIFFAVFQSSIFACFDSIPSRILWSRWAAIFHFLSIFNFKSSTFPFNHGRMKMKNRMACKEKRRKKSLFHFLCVHTTDWLTQEGEERKMILKPIDLCVDASGEACTALFIIRFIFFLRFSWTRAARFAFGFAASVQ